MGYKLCVDSKSAVGKIGSAHKGEKLKGGECFVWAFFKEEKKEKKRTRGQVEPCEGLRSSHIDSEYLCPIPLEPYYINQFAVPHNEC